MRYFLLATLLAAGCVTESLEQRAQNGDLDAVEELAHNVLLGVNGFEKDWDRGVELVNVLAESGNAQAIHQMGIFAMIEREDSVALEYFERAAARGHIPSYELAGSAYLIQPCTTESATKGFRLLMAGVEAGDERSRQRLKGIVSGLKTAHDDGELSEESLECYLEAERLDLIG